MKKTIYLDYGATTPLRKEVFEESKKFFLTQYGNPSSFHSTGLIPKQNIDQARKKISKILDCEKEEIIFTGSGTESINLAIKGIAFKQIIENKKGHFITQKTEHDAVLNTFKWLEKLGFEVTYLNVNNEGLIDLDELTTSIKSETLLVSIMYANNEIGTIQPIQEISKICKNKNVLFHTDACQGAEYLDINVKNLGIDMMTINGSKIYGMKGTGLLYKKKSIKLEPLIHGGNHEFGLRSGTENVPGIIALAKAIELAEKEKKSETKRLTKLRDYLTKELVKIPKTKLNGAKNRLPNNTNISFYGVEGESIMLRLNEKGIRVSTGSACSSQTLDPSHVLRAIGLNHALSHGSIRFTLGKNTTKKDIDYTIKEVTKTIMNLRKISPVWKEAE